MSQSNNSNANRNCPREQEINILLLGQSGIGKSMFINSFANYLNNNTLNESLEDDFKVIIPTSFTISDPDTFEEKVIQLGETENNESNTRQCRSYMFPVGNRNIRLIDTPGMGDVKGLDEDKKRLFEIFSYISHFEHLNGICIFLKPNEERLTITFRFYLKQLLQFSSVTVHENLIFIFTNARSTFYRMGSSKNLLQAILKDIRENFNIDIPFNKENSFLLDNEPLSYIAMQKNHIKIDHEQIQSYERSWEQSSREYERLFSYIFKLPLHAVANTLSLSEIEQVIRKLPRPIAGILRLIQENLQLAKEYKHRLSTKRSQQHSQFTQKVLHIQLCQSPRLVCVSKKCLQFVPDNDENKDTYKQICHKKCYLKTIAQETINELRIAQCEKIDQKTGICDKCDCPANNHMHLTYNQKTRIESKSIEDEETIDQHIRNLKKEQAHIEDTYKKLTQFLYIHAIHPMDDDFVRYLRLFIQEEEMKKSQGAENDQIIEGLQKIMLTYEENMNAFIKTITHENNSRESNDVSNVEKTFVLLGTLYRLPINGQQIRQEVELLKVTEDRAVQKQKRISICQIKHQNPS
ncbi:hypothetical protein I4U23_019846 [Adineta vaga]|nr:hypothetical protein I4U23_019846 [Adineta vaga]